MPAKESFDIDGLMVFRSDLTAVDQDGNTVASVTTPDKYVPSLKEPLSGEQIGRYTNTTAYWRTQSTFVPKKGDVIIYSDGGSITEGGVTVYVPKIKVGDGVTTVGNLLFTDSDNQGGGTEEVLVCIFSSNIVDKTPQEIYEAKTGGKSVICIHNDTVYYLEIASYTNNTYTIIFSTIVNPNGVPEISYIMYFNGAWSIHTTLLQKQLVSGTNIKTINGDSLLGSGDLTIGGVTIYSGSTAPSSATGVDGDIYIQEV